jgi:hypothetical protein
LIGYLNNLVPEKQLSLKSVKLRLEQFRSKQFTVYSENNVELDYEHCTGQFSSYNTHMLIFYGKCQIVGGLCCIWKRILNGDTI